MGTKLKRRRKTREDKIREKPTFGRMPKGLRDELNRMEAEWAEVVKPANPKDYCCKTCTFWSDGHCQNTESEHHSDYILMASSFYCSYWKLSLKFPDIIDLL